MKSWEDLGIKVRKSSGTEYTECPNAKTICNRKKSPKNALRVDHDKCYAFCNHCQVDFQLKEPGDLKTDKMTSKEKEEYKLPEPSNSTALSDKLLGWFKNARGISQRVINELKIREGKTFMPGPGREMNTIFFDYYRDGELVNRKYRSGDKDFKMESGAELILYNLDAISDEDEAIIVEGEMDVCAFYEVGIKNVVSVPNGASITKEEREQYEKTGKLDNNSRVELKYIDNCFEQIKHIKRWYICTDNDAPGIKLRNELVRRFGPENCRVVDLNGHKDANDYILHEDKGVLTLEDRVREAKEPPVQNVIRLHDDVEGLIDFIENGIPRGKTTGNKVLDAYWTWVLGELNTMISIPAHGKTLFALWLIVLNSKIHHWKWSIFVPENMPARRMWLKLMSFYLGVDLGNNKIASSVPKGDISEAMDFVNENFFIMYNIYGVDDVEVIKIAEECVGRWGINGVLIDPYNGLLKRKSGGESDYDYYIRVLTKYIAFKNNHNVAMWVNHHVTAEAARRLFTDENGVERPRVPWFNNAIGGMAWENRTDNGFVMYRNKYGEHIHDPTSVYVGKIKDEDVVGQTTRGQESVPFFWDHQNYRFVNSEDEIAGTKKVAGADNPQSLREWTSLRSIDNMDQPELDF